MAAEQQTAAPIPPAVQRQMFPVVGGILPVPTPAGTVLYRVFKASADRVTLVPLTVAEGQRFMAEVKAAQAREHQAAASARPWWRRRWRPW